MENSKVFRLVSSELVNVPPAQASILWTDDLVADEHFDAVMHLTMVLGTGD